MIPTESRAHARRSLMKSGVLVIGFIVGYSLLPLRGERWWLGAAVGFVAIVGTIPITVRRLNAVRRAEQPILVALEAIILLVAMLLFGFAAVYFAIAVEQEQFNGIETRLDALYFTITTMSTVGYGDINAAGQAARLIVTLQIVLNLAFVGIVVRVMTRAAGIPR